MITKESVCWRGERVVTSWPGEEKGFSPHSPSARSLFFTGVVPKGSDVGQHGGGHEYSAENITSARGWILK